MHSASDRTGARRDPGLLRRGPDRARVPRGRRAAGLGRFTGLADDGRLRGALPRRREPRPVGERLRRVRGRRRREAGPADHRRGERGQRPLGRGAAPAAARRARTVRASRSTCSRSRPSPARPALRAATLDDFDLLVPACAAAHREELGIDPLARDPEGFRWRTRDADRGGPLVALGRGRHDPVQGRGVGVDALRGAAPAGLGRPGRRAAAATPSAGCATSAGCCSSASPTVCLFVRPENAPAIRVYENDRHAPHDLLPQRRLL